MLVYTHMIRLLVVLACLSAAPNALTHPNAAGQRELANWLGPAGHNAGLW